MGTIPTPDITNAIALGQQAGNNSLNEYLRAAQLRQQMGIQREQADRAAQAFPVAQKQAEATLQQTEIQNQAAQQKMAEQKALRDLAPNYVKRGDDGKVAGYDWDGFFQGAAGKVSPAALQKMQQEHAQTLEAYSKLNETQRKKESEDNGFLFQSIEALKGIEDPQQRQAAYRKIVDQAQRRQIDISQFPTQAPGNDELTAMEAPLGMHAELLKNQETEAKIKHQGEPPAAEQEFQAFYKNQLAAKGLQPNARNEYNARLQFAQLHRAPKNDQAAQDAIEAAAQSLAKMDPKDLTRLKDVASLRGDQRLLIYNRAKQINPDFSTATVDRKIKMLDDFQNGKEAQQLQSFGTFLEHAGEASRVTNEFRTTSLPLVNTPINKIRDKFGDASYSRFIASLEPVRKEFEGFLLGGRALYGDDRKAAETILSDNASPAQIQAALKQMGHTVKARYNEIDNRFKNGMGANIQDVIGPLSDDAQEGARQIGIEMGRAKGSSSQAETKNYKGHTYVKQADGSWKLQS